MDAVRAGRSGQAGAQTRTMQGFIDPSAPRPPRMPFLQLTINASTSTLPRYEQVLEDAGALSISLADPDADTPDEQAIFEPGVGQTPLWRDIQLSALFDGDSDALALLVMLEAADPELDFSQAAFELLPDEDWERAWLDQFAPMQFGSRTWIVPWNQPLPEAAQDEQAAVIRLDPGLAFGSGTHPTTALCLQWLDALAEAGLLQGKPVLDFGCGSGILALAALKLGASSAVGVDNDPQAITATGDNAERNGLGGALQAVLPEDEPTACYPVVVANILASALHELAPHLASRVEPGGRIALSGILAGQEDELLERYGEWFDALAVAQEGDWVRIDGVRAQ